MTGAKEFPTPSGLGAPPGAGASGTNTLRPTAGAARRLEQSIMDVCLVTGGAGFIGSHLVKALVARKCTVRVLDNLSTGSLANLGRCARDIEMIVGDLGD